SVNNGTSSRAISNWQYNENKDVNHPRLGTSLFQRRHHILAKAAYDFKYGRGLSTTVSVIYQGYSGQPLSWLYNGNANGDTYYLNDLVYVPNNLSSDPQKRDVILASKNASALNAFIDSHKSLDKYRGQVVPRGSGQQPFQNYLNLRINQKIMTVKGQSLEITASIFNLLNLMDQHWGLHQSVPYGDASAWTLQEYVTQKNMANIQKRTGINLTSADLGKPVIYFNPANTYNSQLYQTNNIESRWRMQIGFQYNF
ncbi:MAG TPA: hypothetical protein VE868_06035, partial [Balneolaceae bacterium]|nr:hypothetical protein [Balneolaceae bacterium]